MGHGAFVEGPAPGRIESRPAATRCRTGFFMQISFIEVVAVLAEGLFA
jgi:hypothetical protein